MKILACFCLLIISACCTRSDCSVPYVQNFEFYNFNSSDLDSLYLYKYNKNSNLLIDSVPIFLGASTVDSIDYGFIETYIDYDFDYKINIASISKSFLITDFVRTELKCKTCFSKLDIVYALESYKINGNIIDSKGYIEINY
jgi:hypothetical protein